MFNPQSTLIVSATPDAENYAVSLEWSNGHKVNADFSGLVNHGIFVPMKDSAFFDKVSVEKGGRVLAWPNAIEFSNAALWFAAHPEDFPRDFFKRYEDPKCTPV